MLKRPHLKFTARIKMKEWLLKLLQFFRLDLIQSQDTEIMGFNSPTTNEIMTPTKSLNLVNLILVRCIEFSVSLLHGATCSVGQRYSWLRDYFWSLEEHMWCIGNAVGWIEPDRPHARQVPYTLYYLLGSIWFHFLNNFQALVHPERKFQWAHGYLGRIWLTQKCHTRHGLVNARVIVDSYKYYTEHVLVCFGYCNKLS